MALSELLLLPLAFFLLLQTLPTLLPLTQAATQNSKLFRAYIGAEFLDVKFSDVPINPGVDFHFILSFAIDYNTSGGGSPTPTNGRFNVFWDNKNLSPAEVAAVKARHGNVRVAVSLGGDSVAGSKAFFSPSSVDSWVSNAASSLRQIVEQYHLDGVDIDYEHFHAGPAVFAECIGRLLGVLKRDGVIKFASIAPYDDPPVQSHYLALWSRYGSLVDYVNFQFYAYDSGTTVPQFLSHFETQSEEYRGGKVMVSYISDGSGGLAPGNGFFAACNRLKVQGKLHGIFVWCADESKADGFRERTSDEKEPDTVQQEIEDVDDRLAIVPARIWPDKEVACEPQHGTDVEGVLISLKLIKVQLQNSMGRRVALPAKELYGL